MRNSSATHFGLSPRTARSRALLAGAGLLVLIAACACSPDTTAVEQRALEFHQLLEEKDLKRACALLQATAREKASSQGVACEEGLSSLELPTAGPVVQTHQYGRSASVEFENGTVFLAVTDSGWRVTGAGCVPEEEVPYTCAIGGN